MHNLRHFYYQNKEKIWKVILIIIFILGIIYLLDKNAIKEDNNQNTPTSSNNNAIYENEENKTYISDKSAISGGTVTETEVKKINNTITKFLQYCKEGESEQAYDMLSTDCKQEQYDTVEKFKSKYLESKFDKEDICEIEKWIGNTYKISISKDLLATGDINNNKKKVEYITIVKENSQEKLNINSYIGSNEINKSQTQSNVKITAISKKTYMDYEIYDFEIENSSNKTIKIDSLEKIGTMYIEDSRGSKHNAYSNEIFEEELEISANHKYKLSIKYTNSYSSSATPKNIVFENIILDYIKYKNLDVIEKEKFKDICELKIEL